jgi:hypothetical protein
VPELTRSVAAAKAASGDQESERGDMGAAEEEKKRRWWRRDMGVVEERRGMRTSEAGQQRGKIYPETEYRVQLSRGSRAG